MNFVVVIPARYASTRLPAKPLLDIHGKPMIQWVVEQANKSGAEQVIVATDDQRIADVVTGFGGQALMTSADHQSGTERLAEVVDVYGFQPETIIVNVQGDEPLIPSEIIQQVAHVLGQQDLASMATLATPLLSVDELMNPNVVKVVRDKFNYALYFSRAPIPYDRDGQVLAQTASLQATKIKQWHRHLGIYAYRAQFIREYANMMETELEQLEKLEQLRVLYHHQKIIVDDAHQVPLAGVDTQEDLERVRSYLA